MPETLRAGDPVVDFTLRDTEGRVHDSRQARSEGLLLFAFWKKTCSTCQYTFPFLQRFHDQYAGPGFAVWGVAQESAADASAFAREHGAAFPQLVDEGLAVTEQYRLASVPTIYLSDAAGRLLRWAPAFVADELNEMARIASERTGKPYVPVVRDADQAPAIKPG